MIKINLGYWQNAVAGETMRKAHMMVKRLHITLSQALKTAWKEVKNFMMGIATTYREYKYKLMVDKKVVNFNIKEDLFDVDELIENCFEKIVELKGKQFMYNVSNRIYKNYDWLINKFKERGNLTFAQDVYIVRVN